MRERPILFSGAMVMALLSGKKTQTRRVINPQPGETIHGFLWKGWVYPDLENMAATAHCPYGQPGDRLWVRETWAENKVLPVEDREPGDFIYRADLNERGVSKWAATWKPSIHMPRRASRINLEITGIRVERLQEISGPDCWAEGIVHDCEKYGSVVHTYHDLWESINGQGSWAANPWVWVVEFKRVDHIPGSTKKI